MSELIAGYASGASEDTSMFELLIYAAIVVGMWKLFVKMDMPGWYALIPFYNYYKLFEAVAGNGILFLTCIVPIVGNLVAGYYTAKAFGKENGFMAGLMIIPFIFMPILGFNGDRYYGPRGVYDTRSAEARQAQTVDFEVVKNDDNTVEFDVETSEE